MFGEHPPELTQIYIFIAMGLVSLKSNQANQTVPRGEFIFLSVWCVLQSMVNAVLVENRAVYLGSTYDRKTFQSIIISLTLRVWKALSIKQKAAIVRLAKTEDVDIIKSDTDDFSELSEGVLQALISRPGQRTTQEKLFVESVVSFMAIKVYLYKLS